MSKFKDSHIYYGTYLIHSSQLVFSVGEMAAIPFDTVLVLGEMFAKSRLVQIVKLLATLLWLSLHDGNWYELSDRRLECLGRVLGHSPNHGGLRIPRRLLYLLRPGKIIKATMD